MDATTKLANALDDFCAACIARHKANWPPAETTLAREFVEQFAPEWFYVPAGIVEFTKKLGIDTSFQSLPETLHGANFSTEGQTLIVLAEHAEFTGSREQTLFHELREIMEHRFRDQGWPTANGSALEDRAEQFAVDVRMTSLTKQIGQLIENAKSVEETWKRWLTFAGVLCLGIISGLSCTLLPHWEKQARLNKKSNR